MAVLVPAIPASAQLPYGSPLQPSISLYGSSAYGTTAPGTSTYGMGGYGMGANGAGGGGMGSGYGGGAAGGGADIGAGAGTGLAPIQPAFIGGGMTGLSAFDLEQLSRQSDRQAQAQRKPADPNEFELYVEKRVGRRLSRFGADLLAPEAKDFAAPSTASVPLEYRINPGDQFVVNLTGSAQGSVNVSVDTDGRVFIPQVGSIYVAGVRYRDLESVITRGVSRQFRSFRATVTMTRLHGVRVYVTGYANAPGAYTVSSLSTLVNAMLAAGGPAGGGSFRAIQLIRRGKVLSTFDLYQLLRKGDKSRDAAIENEDVLYIPPVGSQIAVVGSVNGEAIYETKPGETLADVLSFAGGFNPLADASRVILYAQRNLDLSGGQEVSVAAAATLTARGGDIVQVLSTGALARPLERQAVLVRIEGEIARPGNYYVIPGTTLGQVVAQAGGLTERAFVYGTQFDRFSVRDQQRESYQAAVDQLELSVTSAPLRQGPTSDPASRASELAAARAVLDRLKATQPTGRLVLNVSPDQRTLPETMIVENNDHLYIPPRPTTVGVFGSVYRPGSFEYTEGRVVRSYLERAGGAQRTGDKSDIFVVHANGDVISKRQGALGKQSFPGDVIFVPVKTESSSLLAKLRDISTILFGFGLSAAAVATLTK